MKHLEIIMPELRKYMNERSLLVEEIWKLYDSVSEDNLRKKENWKRYVAFLKEKKMTNSKENQMKFKKSRTFIKKLTPRQIAVKTAHLNKDELSYFFSECKRKAHQGYSIGSFIMFNGLR